MEQWTSQRVRRLYSDTRAFHLWAWVLMEQWASPRVRRLYNDTRAFHLWAWSADGTASGLLQESVVCTTTRVPPVGMEC